MIGWLPSAIGRRLRGRRIGIDKTLFFDESMAATPDCIVVESTAFTNGGVIPQAHSCDGNGSSPPFSWSGIPENAAAVAVVIEDGDSPTSAPMVHLVAWGFAGKDGAVATGGCNRNSKTHGGKPFSLGRNGMYALGYTPPDPPPGHGPHHYLIQVYALNQTLEFSSAPGLKQLARSMKGLVIAKGALEGIYERN